MVVRAPMFGSDASADRSLIRTDGLEGAVLGGEKTRVVHPRGLRHYVCVHAAPVGTSRCCPAKTIEIRDASRAGL